MRNVITTDMANMSCVLAGHTCGLAMMPDDTAPCVPLFTDLTLYQNVQDLDTFVHWLKRGDPHVEIADTAPYPTLAFTNELPPAEKSGPRVIAIRLTRRLSDLRGTSAKLVDLDSVRIASAHGEDCVAITIPGHNAVRAAVSMCDTGILMPYQGYLISLHNESVNMLKTIRERIDYTQRVERIIKILNYQSAIQANLILSEMMNAGDLREPVIMLRMTEMLLDAGVLRNL